LSTFFWAVLSFFDLPEVSLNGFQESICEKIQDEAELKTPDSLF
jgi:hypothetical protein